MWYLLSSNRIELFRQWITCSHFPYRKQTFILRLLSLYLLCNFYPFLEYSIYRIHTFSSTSSNNHLGSIFVPLKPISFVSSIIRISATSLILLDSSVDTFLLHFPFLFLFLWYPYSRFPLQQYSFHLFCNIMLTLSNNVAKHIPKSNDLYWSWYETRV